LVDSNLSAAVAIVTQVARIVEAAPFVQPIGAILSEIVKVYKVGNFIIASEWSLLASQEVQDNHGKRDALFAKVADHTKVIAQAIICLNDNGHAAKISRLGSDLKEYEG
jgi:hypothetical protein